MLPMRPRVHLPGRTGRQNRHALPGVRPSDSRYNGASLRGSLLFAIRPQTGKRHENAARPASRQEKRTSFSGRDTDERGIRQENLPQRPAAASGRRIPATSWLAWGLSLIALILAFISPPTETVPQIRCTCFSACPPWYSAALRPSFSSRAWQLCAAKKQSLRPHPGPMRQPRPKTAGMPGFHAPFRGTGLLGLPVK